MAQSNQMKHNEAPSVSVDGVHLPVSSTLSQSKSEPKKVKSPLRFLHFTTKSSCKTAPLQCTNGTNSRCQAQKALREEAEEDRKLRRRSQVHEAQKLVL